MIPCRRCGRHVDVQSFAWRATSLHMRLANDGNWLADCPACRAPQKWHASDVIPAKLERHVPAAFMQKFCHDVAHRLPLRSVGSTVYCGATPFCPQRDWPNLPEGGLRQLQLLPHRLFNTGTGIKRLVYLPTCARVMAVNGQTLAPGQVWAHCLQERPPASWLAKKSAVRWRDLREAFEGDTALTGPMQDLWLQHQSVMHEDLGEHQFLLPAELVSFVGTAVRPTGLFWDFGKCSHSWNSELHAAVFWPMRLGRWDQLRRALPGDVFLNVRDSTVVAGPASGA